MKKILLLIVFIVSLFATDCNKKLFSLHIVNPVNLKFILSDLVNECKLNIVFKDKHAKKMINQNLEFINIENVTVKDLLNIIFEQADLFYEMKNNTLYISYNKTQTFKIDFIPNSITGKTNINSDSYNSSDDDDDDNDDNDDNDDSKSGENSITSEYKFDFWDNLKSNIVQILQNTSTNFKNPIIDKNSGLITVTGDRNQLEEIKKYINKLNSRLHKEVFIDVKIYSVTLSASHKTGIDWSQLSIQLDRRNVPLRGTYIGGAQSVFSDATFNISGLLNFLAQNGNVNTVSNPKLVALNNQKAMISVGKKIYYKYASDISTNDNGNVATKYTIGSKFVGVLLDITPQISDNGEIILSINPKISEFISPSESENSNRDRPPNTKENTMMSVVRIKNNNTLVLGGLILDDSELKINGVPVLKEIPLIKYLFSSREKISTKKELVFVITPHIINLDNKRALRDYGYKKLPSLEDLNVK